MAISIKCDQMTEWNWDTCVSCKHFALQSLGKGTKWRCSLNNKTAAEKRNFYLIWATNYLIERGALDGSSRYEVAVEYVSKKKEVNVN